MSTIDRRTFLMSTAAAGAALAAQPRLAAREKTSKPNILFLMTDQQRGDCLGVDGNPAIHTPHLDRIANEGARFRCAYTSTPSCTPARAALLTGMDPWSHGMLGYFRVAPKYPVEMPQLLRDAGYYTLGIGKMHWEHQRALHGFHKTILDESGRVQSDDFISDYRAWFNSVAPGLDPDATGIGFNDYRAATYALPEELHPTQWTGMVAENFLKNYAEPDPFFLKVSFARPHSPFDAPKRWMDHYADADLPKASVGKWAERFRERSDNSNNIWHGDMGADQVRHSRQGYYGNISFIDEQIGRILDVLEARGMLENTLIVFTSDHGDMTGDHHLWRKTYAYEASARVPMLVRWPEGMSAGARGQVLDHPCEIRDILPTFLDAAETATPEAVTGRSLLDPIRGKAQDWRKFIDLEHDVCYGKNNHWSAATDGKTKYIYHALDGEEQLFDLTTDPGETTDLAGDTKHTPLLQQWRGHLTGYLEPRGDKWVKSGKLVPRPDSIKLSPNYPTPETAKA